MIKGKVAIVTGASSGIGYATCLALSKAGARVAAGARRTDRLESLEKEIAKNGGEILLQKQKRPSATRLLMPPPKSGAWSTSLSITPASCR
jgi:NAD(P)-dependent dehydrogenase (short-subunit alcohol dehydrogenase family)